MTDDNYRPRLNLKGLLNEAQYQAATHMNGPLLIVAGAGSGKTRTLVYRVAWLIDQGVDPSSILLLTFTRKAASEMLSRCEELVGSRVGRVSGGTFHSLAKSILRVYAPKLGFTNQFVIMDQDDSESLIGRLRNEDYAAKNHSKFPKRNTIHTILSQAINKDLSINKLMKKSFPHLLEFESAIIRINNAYQQYKYQADLMDFDDLLVKLERLLIENDHIRQEIASRYNYILVDEYQDTNPIQARLTAHLGQEHANVTAVGDEAQSIYAFRGANFRNIMDFPATFPGTRILKLEENYRSHPQVLTVANHLLAQAKERYDKTLRTNRPDGPLSKIIYLSDTMEEAVTVADLITADLESGMSPKDIAVLFRAGSHSFELEAQLTRRHIPYTKYGGRKFLEIAHIKDFLCYLRLSVNSKDTQSLRRVLGHVTGLGPKGQEKVAAWASEQTDYISYLDQVPLSRSKAKEHLTKLKNLLLTLTSLELSPEPIVEEIYEYYSALLPNLYPDDYPERKTDLIEIKNMASQTSDLVSFLADLTLDPPNNLTVSTEKIRTHDDLTLSTIHSAKGLEWRKVYLISAVEGRFPSAYVKGPSEIEEELRLMYVAVTRACDQLTVTVPLGGSLWGNSDPKPARFLQGLKPDQVEFIQDGRTTKIDPMDLSFDHLEEIFQSEYSPAKRVITNPRERRSSSPVHSENAYQKPANKTSQTKADNLATNTLLEINLGQRVYHPIFGSGSVSTINGGSAIIDFDQFGKKNVMIRFAKLTSLEK
jgi:DNA helicase-2/ATP-dependent DNA helicase PcrA